VGIAGKQTWNSAPAFVGDACRSRQNGGQRPLPLTKYAAVPDHHL